MTYEEYKNSKKEVKKETSKKNILSDILSKFFTIVIFTMIVIIISNYSPEFRNFITDKVLNSTFDFSTINKIINKTTSIFEIENNTQQVIKNDIENESYLDGVKYYIGENEKIYLKNSGIVTFIGEKEGYNNTIVIQQSDGYYAWYGNVNENIKLYDYVESGEEIGTASDEYYYVLLKDDKPVKINEQD